MITFSLNEIRMKRPCKNGWHRLLSELNEHDFDARINASKLVEINGISETLWVLGEFGHHKEISSFALSCARNVSCVCEGGFPNTYAVKGALSVCNAENASVICGEMVLAAERFFAHGSHDAAYAADSAGYAIATLAENDARIAAIHATAAASCAQDASIDSTLERGYQMSVLVDILNGEFA